MTKSQLLSNKLNLAQSYIEKAQRLVNSVINEDQNESNLAVLFDNNIDNIMDIIDDIGYEVIMPIEMEEEEEGITL